ncbi:hypothetical protein RRG08_036167 [Elysia crispata]|uniref:Uncharacterized protein n=1 Tax=Elysia crispata TaxID=231223 RepID=A0AAE0XET2_9GAST|nr:hypothetical protein RRG08_036167 [Elysia crispata]
MPFAGQIEFLPQLLEFTQHSASPEGGHLLLALWSVRMGKRFHVIPKQLVVDWSSYGVVERRETEINGAFCCTEWIYSVLSFPALNMNLTPSNEKTTTSLYGHTEPQNLTFKFRIKISDTVLFGIHKSYITSYNPPVSISHLQPACLNLSSTTRLSQSLIYNPPVSISHLHPPVSISHLHPACLNLSSTTRLSPSLIYNPPVSISHLQPACLNL